MNSFDILEREQVWTKLALSPRRKFLAAGMYLKVTEVASSGDWQHSRMSWFSQHRHKSPETSAWSASALGWWKQPMTQQMVSLGLYQGESWAWGKAHVLLNHLNHSSGFLWILMHPCCPGTGYTTQRAAFPVGWLCWQGVVPFSSSLLKEKCRFDHLHFCGHELLSCKK